MTIRLLAAYGKYPCNAIVTLDSATEAGLIAAKQALADLTGGSAYVAPAPQKQSFPVMGEVDLTGGIRTLAVLTQAQYDALVAGSGVDEFTNYKIVAA